MSYTTATLALAKTMLANIAAFRTFVAAADVNAALAQIISIDGDPVVANNYAKIGIAPEEDEEIGVGNFRRAGEIGIGLWRHDVRGATPETKEARAAALYDIADDVRTGLYALRGTAGSLAMFTVAIGDPMHFAANTGNAHKSMIPLTLKYRG